jgi:hypothetical protein
MVGTSLMLASRGVGLPTLPTLCLCCVCVPVHSIWALTPLSPFIYVLLCAVAVTPTCVAPHPPPFLSPRVLVKVARCQRTDVCVCCNEN